MLSAAPNLASASSPVRPYDIGPAGSEERFLAVLKLLADEFLSEAETRAGALLDAHTAALSSGKEASCRSRGELAIELLTFGILRVEYGGLAARTSDANVQRLEQLWRLRSEDPARKREADSERGRIFLGLLSEPSSPAAPCGDARLVEWLAATGEFVQEALRLRLWLSSAASFGLDDFERVTAGLAAWFIPRALERLGAWTRGVAAFREQVLSRPEPREDLLLITRGESLYHLNMVGSEVMNRGFLPGYQKRPGKVVLVPGCMRARDDASCRAKRDGLDISCAHCHAGCEVAALDTLARERGFRVFVVPHASSFTAWLKHWQKDESTSLVAVACPLHLVPGGYEMRALGLEAQCVLLQYSGCKRHWDPAGVPTRLNRQRLLEVVERGGVVACSLARER